MRGRLRLGLDPEKNERNRETASACDDQSSISYITIVIGACNGGTPAIRTLIQEARKEVSEVLGRWAHVTAVGRFEVDILPPGAIPGTFKLKTLRACGYDEAINKTYQVPPPTCRSFTCWRAAKDYLTDVVTEASRVSTGTSSTAAG